MTSENEHSMEKLPAGPEKDKVLWARRVRIASELGIMLALASFPLAAWLAGFVRDEKGGASPVIFMITTMLVNGAACVLAMWARRERAALPAIQAWIPGCGCLVTGLMAFLTALLVALILLFPFWGMMAE